MLRYCPVTLKDHCKPQCVWNINGDCSVVIIAKAMKKRDDMSGTDAVIVEHTLPSTHKKRCYQCLYRLQTAMCGVCKDHSNWTARKLKGAALC